MEEQKGKFILMVNASKGRSKHMTMVYIEGVDENKAKETYINLVKAYVKPKDGKYLCSCEKDKMWGRNSVLLKGDIVDFKDKVDKAFQELGKPSIRKAHVDVGGHFDCELLSELDLMDFSVKN
jgi:hypothetical protein